MQATRQRILVVDDEPDILDTMSSFLQSALPGVDVATAENGLVAWESLQKTPADLVLSDYKMPVLDGLSLLERVSRKWPDVPTVLITAFADVQLAIRAINEGRVRRFLTKPLEPKLLEEVARAMLEDRLARQQREAALKRAAASKGGPAPTA